MTGNLFMNSESKYLFHVFSSFLLFLIVKNQGREEKRFTKKEKFDSILLIQIIYILSSSVVEQSAVNRLVVGSSPTWGDNSKNIAFAQNLL
jgi:hypothetical protein